MLSLIGVLLFGVAGPVFCLAIFLECGTRHALRFGKSSGRYTAASICGWLLGIVGACAGVGTINDVLDDRTDIPDGLVAVLGIGAVLAGALAGASVGYVWLRMATKRDADYGDPAAVPRVDPDTRKS